MAKADTGKTAGKTRGADKKPLKPVYFVGAGPGDAELITVRGMKLIKRADVVVYAGSLVSMDCLKYRKKGAKVYTSADKHLEEIVDIMIRAARAGKTVVRLHTGDTSLYSAFREQADMLDRAGIAYEVVPGVSSAFAAAAVLKKEFTMPGGPQTVIFTRLEGRTPVPRSESLTSLAAHGASMCIFLSVSDIGTVVRRLKRGGYAAGTPVAVVYKATWPDEARITGTLGDIAKKVKEAGIKRHSVIIVGKALGDGKALSRLYDKGFDHMYRKSARKGAQRRML